MSKLHKRKGFTLTELAVVIAIIAVLIAVLVPTFYTLIKNAKESSDSQLTKNMNEAVSIEDATSGIETPEDAITAALSVGYSVENLSAKSEGNIIVYDQESKSFVLISEDLENVIYNNTKDNYKTATTWLFLETSDSSVVTSAGANAYTISGSNSYILIGEEWAGATITVTSASGIDTSQVTSTASASASSIKVITANNSQSAVNPVAAKTAVAAEESATVYPILYNVKNAYLKYTGGSNPVKIFGSTYVSVSVSGNTNSITVANTVSYVDVTNSSDLTIDIESNGSTKLLAFGEVTVKSSSGTVISVTTLSDKYESKTEGESLSFSDLITVSSDTYSVALDENGKECIEVTSPTCTTGGYTTTTYVNNYTGTEITVIDQITSANGHTSGEAVTENEAAATCTTDGSHDTVHYCTVCGEEVSRETVTVEATGHTDANNAPVFYKIAPVIDDNNEIVAAVTYKTTHTCEKCGVTINEDTYNTEYIEISKLSTALGESYNKAIDELYDEGNTHSIGSWEIYFYEGCAEIGIEEYSDESTENVIIPINITDIGINVFDGHTEIKSIIIPSTVTSICNSAFKDCTSLTSVTV